MQQIINVLIKNKNFVVFASLLLFTLIFFNNKSYYHSTKLNTFIINLSGKIFNFNSSIKYYMSLKEENRALLKENKRLKKNLINKEKFDSSKKGAKFKYEIIDAKIIKNSIRSARNFILLDKGKRDGVVKEMGVISSNGIVGVISSVSENYSNVISILNRDLSINAKHKKSNAFGSLNWNGIDSDKLQLHDITTINIINVGDTIITGGMSTYFPKDILIGEISDYKIFKQNGYYDIEIKLFDNIGNLNNVYIINNRHKDEIKSIQ